jgi:hypothetical protein
LRVDFNGSHFIVTFDSKKADVETATVRCAVGCTLPSSAMRSGKPDTCGTVNVIVKPGKTDIHQLRIYKAL